MRPSIISEGATISAPGVGLDQRLLGQDLDRVVVDDVADIVDHAVVAVRRIWVERDVGQNTDLGHRIFDGADRSADQVVGAKRFLGALRAELLGRVREERDARNAEIGRLARFGRDAIDAPAADARKRTDRLLAVAALADEQGPDEVGRMQPVLGKHRAHPRARAPAAHA